MTKQTDILADPKALPVLDHGFVRIVDSLGSDQAIANAARVSYGEGTKSVREDRNLIRYLVRHAHTSPIEMGVVKFHLKMPIFVARQIVRHRTHSMNEYSGRYSVMPEEFYTPDLDAIKPQSDANKQGREGVVDATSKNGVQWYMKAIQDNSYDVYRTLLGERWENQPYDPYDGESPLFGSEFKGVARELARTVLPLSNYTEFYWMQNLHNLLHLFKLRADSHAQYEIRVYAEAVYKLIEPIFPLTCEAFQDYQNQGLMLSRMERQLLKHLLHAKDASDEMNRLAKDDGIKGLADEYGMSQREIREFAETWGIAFKG